MKPGEDLRACWKVQVLLIKLRGDLILSPAEGRLKACLKNW